MPVFGKRIIVFKVTRNVPFALCLSMSVVYMMVVRSEIAWESMAWGTRSCMTSSLPFSKVCEDNLLQNWPDYDSSSIAHLYGLSHIDYSSLCSNCHQLAKERPISGCLAEPIGRLWKFRFSVEVSFIALRIISPSTRITLPPKLHTQLYFSKKSRTSIISVVSCDTGALASSESRSSFNWIIA